MKREKNLLSVLLGGATVAILALGLTPVAPLKPVLSNSVSFDQEEVEQKRFIALASPYGANRDKYNLFILEQISNTQACWNEDGKLPTQVDPLMLNFDFAGICGRSTDHNGYALRLEGQDRKYDLKIVKQGNDLLLLGVPSGGNNIPPLEIGRSHGTTDGLTKIFLNPEWRFTKRAYQGKRLGLTYITKDPVGASIAGSNPSSVPAPATSTPEVPGGI